MFSSISFYRQNNLKCAPANKACQPISNNLRGFNSDSYTTSFKGKQEILGSTIGALIAFIGVGFIEHLTTRNPVNYLPKNVKVTEIVLAQFPEISNQFKRFSIAASKALKRCHNDQKGINEAGEAITANFSALTRYVATNVQNATLVGTLKSMDHTLAEHIVDPNYTRSLLNNRHVAMSDDAVATLEKIEYK